MSVSDAGVFLVIRGRETSFAYIALDMSVEMFDQPGLMEKTGQVLHFVLVFENDNRGEARDVKSLR